MSHEVFSIRDPESHSSLFEKLPADLRGRLDQAIIDREPAGYRAVFAKFELAKYSVSFTAFYYYARRLRAQTDLLHIADLAGLDGLDVAGALPKLLAYRIFEAANDEDASPLVLQRLVNAWRTAVNTHLALQRQEAVLAEARGQAQEQLAAGPGRALHQTGNRLRAGTALAAQAIPPTIKLAEVSNRSRTARAAPGVSARPSVPQSISKNQRQARPLAEQRVPRDESGAIRPGAPAEVQETRAGQPTARRSRVPQATPPASAPSAHEQGSSGKHRVSDNTTPGSSAGTARGGARSGPLSGGLFKPVRAGSTGPGTRKALRGLRLTGFTGVFKRTQAAQAGADRIRGSGGQSQGVLFKPVQAGSSDQGARRLHRGRAARSTNLPAIGASHAPSSGKR